MDSKMCQYPPKMCKMCNIPQKGGGMIIFVRYIHIYILDFFVIYSSLQNGVRVCDEDESMNDEKSMSETH